MKILTIPPLVHDTSVCVIEDGEIKSYKMEERFSRKKHDFKLDNILEQIILENTTKFDKIIIPRHFIENFVGCTTEDIVKKISALDYEDLIITDGEHHLFHAYCGFYNSGFDHALCFSLDGSGAIKRDGNIEVESVYEFNKKSEPLLTYQRTRNFLQKNPLSYEEYYAQIPWDELSVGEKFLSKCKELWSSDPIDNPGKLMGLAQYKHHKDKLKFPYNSREWKEKVDIAHEVQQETQQRILNLIKRKLEDTETKNVVISGGYGLNCVANYQYLKELPDINFYIDPVCFDAGISIGSAYYHYSKHSKDIQPLKNVYIGHHEKEYNLNGLDTKKVSYDDIIDLIVEKNAVALFQGKSEAGQRSLGNRSLLFDPRISNGKELVNEIKKRENYRPFAGSILLEEASKWFKMLSLKESPYMQYAVDAYDNAIEEVPAIIHADNTCRIQTVSKVQNEHFYELIQTFFKRTNVPILLNTSFNLGGEPLVETFDHAIKTLKNSKIEYLYLPEIETLVTIKNKKFTYV